MKTNKKANVVRVKIRSARELLTVKAGIRAGKGEGGGMPHEMMMK